MRVVDALRMVRRLYLDAAPLIYYVEEHPDYGQPMASVIDAIERTPIAALTSVIPLTEVLSQPMQRGDTLIEQE